MKKTLLSLLLAFSLFNFASFSETFKFVSVNVQEGYHYEHKMDKINNLAIDHSFFTTTLRADTNFYFGKNIGISIRPSVGIMYLNRCDVNGTLYTTADTKYPLGTYMDLGLGFAFHFPINEHFDFLGNIGYSSNFFTVPYKNDLYIETNSGLYLTLASRINYQNPNHFTFGIDFNVNGLSVATYNQNIMAGLNAQIEVKPFIGYSININEAKRR